MTRSLEPELMDSPAVCGPILDRFHRDLDRVNKLLGTFTTIRKFLQQDAQPIGSVLDIGCGDGALLRYLRSSMKVNVVGVDQKPGAAEDVRIVEANAITSPLPRADVAVSSLVIHHLTPEENIELIRNVGRSCRRFLILDLVRHPLPLALFSVFLCPLIGWEAAHDGRLSIRRAYTPAEFGEIVRQALRGTGGSFTSDVSLLRSRQITDIRYA